MKKILILGEANIGKTTFLRNFYYVLLKIGAEEEYKEQVGENEKDFIGFIKFGSKKICINTAGDQVNYIKKALKQSKEKECNILLSACQKGVYNMTTFPSKEEFICLDAKQIEKAFTIITNI